MSDFQALDKKKQKNMYVSFAISIMCVILYSSKLNARQEIWSRYMQSIDTGIDLVYCMQQTVIGLAHNQYQPDGLLVQRTICSRQMLVQRTICNGHRLVQRTLLSRDWSSLQYVADRDWSSVQSVVDRDQSGVNSVAKVGQAYSMQQTNGFFQKNDF